MSDSDYPKEDTDRVNKFLANHLKNQARPYLRRAYPSNPMEPLDLQVGDAVRFYGIRTNAPIRTAVRATTEHYALCTWQSTTKGVDAYTIISWRDGWRGPHGSYGHGANTDEECRDTLSYLESGQIEMSQRAAIYLDIAGVSREGNTIFDDTKDDL